MSDDDQNEDGSTPSWKRRRLRSSLYASTDRNGKPCESIWTFTFPADASDDGYLRRLDFCLHTTESYGDWDNLTREGGLKLLEELEAEAAATGARAPETPEKIDRHEIFMNNMTLENWQALTSDSSAALALKKAISVSRPLQLGARAAQKPAMRLQLK